MWYIIALLDGEEITVYVTRYKDAAENAAASFPASCKVLFVPDKWNKDENKRILPLASAKTATI